MRHAGGVLKLPGNFTAVGATCTLSVLAAFRLCVIVCLEIFLQACQIDSHHICSAEDMKEMLTQLEVDVGELGALMQLAGVFAVCSHSPVFDCTTPVRQKLRRLTGGGMVPGALVQHICI